MKKVLLFLIILCVGCNNVETKLGQYLYEAEDETIHADKMCEANKQKGLEFIDTLDFIDGGEMYCPICISDETYRHIKRISYRNKYPYLCVKETSATSYIHPTVKRIYDAKKEAGDNVGTLEEFNNWFLAKGEEGYKHRKEVWQQFHDAGADFGDNYEEFAGWLGLHAVKPATTAKNGGASISPKIKGLYKAYQRASDYNGSEDDFNKWFFAKGNEGYKNRKTVYDAVTLTGGDAGANYEEFAERLGLKAVK